MPNDFSSRLIRYTAAEEVANRLTHGVAAPMFLLATIWLLVRAAETGDPYRIASSAVFGVALSGFYVISTLYHSLRGDRVRYLFRILDHAGIFLVIAGSYTPFTLVSLRDGWGWPLFGVVWGVATAGLVFKSFMPHRLRIVMPLLYLALGWLAVLVIVPLRAALSPDGLGWLLAGGVCYSVGLIFYASICMRFNHAIWHLFVIAGSLCHYFCVLWYVVPL